MLGINKAGVIKTFAMGLGWIGMMLIVMGAPSAPSPGYPFGKPMDLTLILVGLLFCFLAFIIFMYIFVWRRLTVGRDYFWIEAVIRDLAGNWRYVLWAIPKDAEIKTLKSVERRLIEETPDIYNIVQMFEAELREKFIWQKIPVISYGENDEKYEGYIVVGMTDNLLANIGEGGFKHDTIYVEGLPVYVEHAPLEFLELGCIRISEIDQEESRNMFRRFRKRFESRVEDYGTVGGEEIKQADEEPAVFYKVKKIPCLLLLGSPLMYQKMALLGLNLIQMFKSREDAMQHLIEVKQQAYTDYANDYISSIRMRDQHIKELLRNLRRHVDFSVIVSPQRIYEMTPTQAAISSAKKWIIGLVLAIIFSIFAYMFLVKYGVI